MEGPRGISNYCKFKNRRSNEHLEGLKHGETSHCMVNSLEDLMIVSTSSSNGVGLITVI